MAIRFVALPTEAVHAVREGAPDANGMPVERHVAPTGGLPCRHCLGAIDKGEELLVLAWRPFPEAQPYAEVGPIFLHGRDCARGGGSEAIPAFLNSPRYIVRGYGADDRIVYGTGAVIETERIPGYAEELLARPGIAYAHVRSATNNCFHCRIERG